jgi:hypothetical protein
MPRNAVQATPRTVLAIKVPRVPEERVLPKQTVKIHPVVGIFGFLEFKGERFQRSLELIEGPLRTASTAFLNRCSQLSPLATLFFLRYHLRIRQRGLPFG